MIHISAKTWDALCQHAQEIFPDECCGAILVKNDREEVRRIANIQNAMRAKDPQQFPRDATIAYFMEPKELLAVNREVDSGKAALKAFYHSHPNHDAYFSAEDKRQAMFGDEPSYPDTAYLVVSVYDRQVRNIKAYRWDEATKDFVEAELRTNV
jgi:[CysO sulfur-carrier protein]-S-L-cysteine hydrolase